MSAVPSPEGAFLDFPLYLPVRFDDDSAYSVVKIKHYLGPLDSYCPECGTDSVFRRTETEVRRNGNAPQLINVGPLVVSDFDQWVSGIYHRTASGCGSDGEVEYRLGLEYFQIATSDPTFTVTFECTRQSKHKLHYHFSVQTEEVDDPRLPERYRGVLVKTGQYPSLADLALANASSHRDILPARLRADYNRAIGLHAHGVGAGSLIYLRRIYEHLLVSAYEAAQREDNQLLPREQRRAKEMLRDLGTRLPDHMSENPVIYGILSKGVHELDEDECSAHFPVLKRAVDLILLDLYQQREEDRIRTQSKRDLDRLGRELKGSK